jgi:hypothetical protein
VEQKVCWQKVHWNGRKSSDWHEGESQCAPTVGNSIAVHCIGVGEVEKNKGREEEGGRKGGRKEGRKER